MNETQQFAVSGYYGCGNAGDEAVLAGIREALARRAGNGVRLLALSQNPEATTKLHGIQAADRMNFSELRAAFRASDLLLSGGGSLLQDTTSVRSLLYYLWVARLALHTPIPLMFYAQGIGPLRRAMSRTLVRMVANRAAYITVRDESSARLLTALGVSGPPIEITADPAFALTPAPNEIVASLMQAEGLPTDKPMIGVALRPWGGAGDSPVANYAQLLTELGRQTEAQIVLIPMQAPNDVDFAAQVAEQTDSPDAFPILRGHYPPDVLLGIIGKMQTVVAMRLHALIFAARAGAPPFALAYDPKVEHLMQGLGLEESMENWRGFEPAEVAARVALLANERESRSFALQAQMPLLEQKALRNADCAMQAAKKGQNDRDKT